MKNEYAGKKVLVTGGSGFIGSHLVEKLIKLEAKVTVLDNYSSGKLQNLRNILDRVNLVYGDIRSKQTCLKLTANQDIVFHTAALVSVPYSFQYPVLCKQINIMGTKNLLHGCKVNNVRNFVFSSSAAVYGNKNDECNENDKPNPESPYAKSKLIGEQLCKEYSQKYGTNTVCLRYFNVYGDRQSTTSQYSGVVAIFKYNMQHNKPLIIYGNGKQSRDFIHVSKVVDANLRAGLAQNMQGEVFNIASGKSITLLELIEQLETENNLRATNISFVPARTGDIFVSKADCSKSVNQGIIQ